MPNASPFLLCCLPLLLVTTPASALKVPARDPELARLCADYWQGYLKANPTFATSIGDRRYDDRLPDITPAGIEREQQRLGALLARSRGFSDSRLSPDDRLNRSALTQELQNQMDRISCHFENWVVDPLGGPQVDLFNLPDYTTIDAPADAARFVASCRAMGRHFDDHVANLRSGLASGRVASYDAVRRVGEELDRLLAQPIEEWSLMHPAGAAHPRWPARDRDRFRTDLAAALADSVRPAIERYRRLVQAEIVPASRPPEKAGMVNLPGGLDCYRAMVRVETSLDKTPEELHRIGLAEVARFRSDLAALGARSLGTSDVAEIQRRLRGDPAMHFATAEAIEARARETLARAKAAIPSWFGVLPKADCAVRVMGMHEAPQSTIAYYRNAAKDGSRPGYYMINTYAPETRPRYEAEALAFHESIPGHHLQIAIAMELEGLPEFRKYQGTTAFVEGWALYAERLADEMGLYSSDTDRIGMLSYDAWRSCRLVVDTGLHAMGWTRQQAIDYMRDNSVLAENNIENEVDRYLTWPAQALAYKCGQLEIFALRDEAKQRLGARFDIKAFHDAVLKNGAVTLPVLHQQIEAWIAARAGSR